MKRYDLTWKAVKGMGACDAYDYIFDSVDRIRLNERNVYRIMLEARKHSSLNDWNQYSRSDNPVQWLVLELDFKLCVCRGVPLRSEEYRPDEWFIGGAEPTREHARVLTRAIRALIAKYESHCIPHPFTLVKGV